eukprot:14843809-Heterocapsa_arctica.AAC.1
MLKSEYVDQSDSEPFDQSDVEVQSHNPIPISTYDGPKTVRFNFKIRFVKTMAFEVRLANILNLNI